MKHLHRLISALLLALCMVAALAQPMYDASGRQIGRVDAERFYNASGQQIGRVDGERVYDNSSRQIGRADGLRRMQRVVFFYFSM